LGFNSSKTIKLLNTSQELPKDATRGRFINDADGIKVQIRHPDIITIQTGLHVCQHASPDSKGRMNTSMVEKNLKDLPKLMKAVRVAVDRHNGQHEQGHRNITVIVSTSGRIGYGAGSPHNPRGDDCITNFNRAAARAARAEGFAVFERGEIEQRLLYASQNREIAGPEYEILRFRMHLDAPAPEIVSTALLSLITCLRNETFFN
jgi:hypothetical protein